MDTCDEVIPLVYTYCTFNDATLVITNMNREKKSGHLHFRDVDL